MVRLLFEPSGGFILETATAYWSIDFVFGHMIYPIPFDLGSQDDSSQASSSTVGDHVQSPGTERSAMQTKGVITISAGGFSRKTAARTLNG